jgi:hypothetical protein
VVFTLIENDKGNREVGAMNAQLECCIRWLAGSDQTIPPREASDAISRGKSTSEVSSCCLERPPEFRGRLRINSQALSFS